MASSSYSQTPSSFTQTSTPNPTLWDAFLNFRGKDTRYTFTGHLYRALHGNGIRTFRDDPELRSGDVISRALPQAIQESKTYIVVLSENYASSSWCLDELVEILNCYTRLKRLIVPVFYNIDPSVVRRQIGSFKEAFAKHQTRFEMVKVDQWRLALETVADFSGYYVSENRSEADIIDEVVERVLLEINPRTLDVAKYPVGLDSHVRGITALFISDTEGVIRIGIHGMGGVGKTTLAKAVYNQNYLHFEASCFLANVREASTTDQGLVCLQKQLIADVLKRNNIDIGSIDQGIELIRARICSKKVLIVIDDLDKPKPLEFLEGSYALGSMIIITTRNEDLLDSIDVKARYKVNELDDDQSRQLFAQHAFGDYKISDRFTKLSHDIIKRAGGLPLALTVFGSNLFNQQEEAWRWFIDKLNRVPVEDIEKKLLISFDALKLIDPMLQNIFLDIACFFIGWDREEVVKILETFYTFVNRNIDILMKRCLVMINDRDQLQMHDLLREMGRGIARNNLHDEPGKHSRLWVSKDISTMLKNHKGTEAIEGIISGSLNYKYFKAAVVTFAAESFKRMSKLRFLYLNGVNLTGSFEQTFKDLRWLHWTYCPLKCFPSEFYPHKLVILELPHSNMRTMRELNMVFEKLKTLNMSSSPYLTTTPDFTRLPCLETLNLSDCRSLKEVHISIGSLARLVSLDLGWCSELRSLPDTICSLRALEVLNISHCVKLEELPDQLGKITSLRKLHALTATQLKMIPDISQLSNIEDLDLSDCHHLLSIVGLPPNLKQISALYCWSLERLPNLSNLKHLKELKLINCSSLTEIQGMEELTSLESLYLWKCIKLLYISNFAPNLKRIVTVGCTSMQRLPYLSNLKQLEELKLINCSSLTEIQGFEELTCLERLEVRRCRFMKRLPNLSNLKRLERLDLTNCRGLTEIQVSEELTSLRQLFLTGCNSSLLASILTKHFFQMSCEFQHKIEISVQPMQLPNWISQSSKVRGSRISLHLPSNESHSILGIIFLIITHGYYGVEYSVKNMASGFTWGSRHYGSVIVILPSSIFPIRDDDHNNFEIVFNEEIFYGIHLVYKTEITTISQYDCTTAASVEEERSNPSLSDLEIKFNSLSLDSYTVDVEEEIRHSSKRLKR